MRLTLVNALQIPTNKTFNANDQNKIKSTPTLKRVLEVICSSSNHPEPDQWMAERPTACQDDFQINCKQTNYVKKSII